MKLIIITFISLLLFCNTTIAEDYTIIDNTVFFEDSNIYLSATPHTLSSSEWVYFNLTSKVYTGNIDICWGFNTSISKPTKAELYKPHWVNTTTNREKIFYNPTFYPYAGDNLDYGNSYNINYTYTIIEEIVGDNGTTYITSNASFDSYINDGINYTIFWHSRHDNYYLWKDFTSSFNSLIYDYEGFDKWYYIKNVSVNANVNYMVRGWVDIPVSTEIQKGKYYFAVKPSHESIAQAVNNGHFYNLDPWWDASWSTQTEIILTGGASGAQTDYQLLLNVSYETGMQSDFDDLRFCNDTDKIDSWLESKVDGSYALVWVEFPTTPANGINQTYYMYYGNVGAASNWDGTATFPDFFEDNEAYSDGYDIGNVWTLLQDKATTNEYSTSAAKTGNIGIKIVGDGIGSSAWKKTNSMTLPFIFQSWLYVGSGDITNKFCGFSWDQTEIAYMLLSGYNNINWQLRYAATYHTTTLQVTVGWHKIELKAAADGSAVIYIDGVELSESFPTGEIDDNEIIISNYKTETSYYDELFLHKYAINPPTYTFGAEEYYVNSIHYNTTDPYNHTIDSNSVIAVNRTIIASDSIGWTASALTDDCHLIVTQYNLNNVTIANFTLYTLSLDWLTVPGLTEYTNYSLLFANGTLIESQITDNTGIVYFTTNLDVGSYIIEKGKKKHPFSENAFHFYDEMESGLTDFKDDMGRYLVWGIIFFAIGLAFTLFTKIKQTLIGGK